MKKITSSLLVVMFLMMGAPFLHGLTPKYDKNAFGKAVSGLAQMYPGAVADHVSN